MCQVPNSSITKVTFVSPRSETRLKPGQACTVRTRPKVEMTGQADEPLSTDIEKPDPNPGGLGFGGPEDQAFAVVFSLVHHQCVEDSSVQGPDSWMVMARESLVSDALGLPVSPYRRAYVVVCDGSILIVEGDE
jgi:hypothetical protein